MLEIYNLKKTEKSMTVLLSKSCWDFNLPSKIYHPSIPMQELTQDHLELLQFVFLIIQGYILFCPRVWFKINKKTSKLWPTHRVTDYDCVNTRASVAEKSFFQPLSPWKELHESFKASTFGILQKIHLGVHCIALHWCLGRTMIKKSASHHKIKLWI